MATDVGIINHGKLLFQRPLKELHDLQRKKSMLYVDGTPYWKCNPLSFDWEYALVAYSPPFQGGVCPQGRVVFSIVC